MSVLRLSQVLKSRSFNITGIRSRMHPFALLRDHLAKRRVVPADKLHEGPNQARVWVAGIVKHRQRPESAKGVMFVTLHDETGVVRAVVWSDLGERQRKTRCVPIS